MTRNVVRARSRKPDGPREAADDAAEDAAEDADEDADEDAAGDSDGDAAEDLAGVEDDGDDPRDMGAFATI